MDEKEIIKMLETILKYLKNKNKKKEKVSEASDQNKIIRDYIKGYFKGE